MHRFVRAAIAAALLAVATLAHAEGVTLSSEGKQQRRIEELERKLAERSTVSVRE